MPMFKAPPTWFYLEIEGNIMEIVQYISYANLLKLLFKFFKSSIRDITILWQLQMIESIVTWPTPKF